CHTPSQIQQGVPCPPLEGGEFHCQTRSQMRVVGDLKEIRDTFPELVFDGFHIHERLGVPDCVENDNRVPKQSRLPVSFQPVQGGQRSFNTAHVVGCHHDQTGDTVADAAE